MDASERDAFQRIISGLSFSFSIEEDSLNMKVAITEENTVLMGKVTEDSIPSFFDGVHDLYDQLRFSDNQLILNEKTLVLKIKHGPRVKQFNFPLQKITASFQDQIRILKEQKLKMATIILELELKVQLLQQDKDDYVKKYCEIKEEFEILKEKCQCWKKIQIENEIQQSNMRKRPILILNPKREEEQMRSIESKKKIVSYQIEKIKKNLENIGKTQLSPYFRLAIEDFLKNYNDKNKTTHESLQTCSQQYQNLQKCLIQNSKPSQKKFIEFFVSIKITGVPMISNNSVYTKLFQILSSLFQLSDEFISNYIQKLKISQFQELPHVYSAIMSELENIYNDHAAEINIVRKDKKYSFINISLKNKSIAGNMWIGRLNLFTKSFQQSLWSQKLKSTFQEFDALNKQVK